MGKEGKMQRSHCPSAAALELIGDRWSLLIIRAYIFAGCREYGDFLAMPEGISTNILANRLAWLTENNMLTKHDHPSNRRKYYYVITDKGFDLIVVIMELARWGWTYLPDTRVPAGIQEAFVRDREAFVDDWKQKVTEQTREYLETAAVPN